MNINDTIKAMLTENTGIAMCDSGGSGGRHWQRNQETDFDNEPEIWFDPIHENDTDSENIWFTVSVYKYLTSGILELDDLCNEFNALPVDDWNGDYYGTSGAGSCWIDSLERELTPDGEAFNTYNGECFLSQTLQGQLFERGDDSKYLLLQIHQGADVRGGYTDAKLFKLNRWIEHINPCPSVYGTIDSVEVGTGYSGWGLSTENGQPVPVSVESEVNLAVCFDI